MPSPRHLSTGKSDWQTPKELLDLVVRFNDGIPIALDPFSTKANPTKATRFFHLPAHDGYVDEWQEEGITFVNPPYPPEKAAEKCAVEYEEGRAAEILLLVPPRTETAFFHESIVNAATAICFWCGWKGEWSCFGEDVPKALCRSRIQFIDPATGKTAKYIDKKTNEEREGGNTTASMIAYYGPRQMRFRKFFSPFGWVTCL